jgi:tRNA(Ile)-lysidine synthase
MSLLVLAVASGLHVTAVHVDHGLRDGSDVEAEVVERAAARFGAGFRSETAEVAPGPNLEARARAARYAALPEGVLVGHTADDQAETIVMSFLRGGAWHGLGGMRPSEHRPLLGLRRADTEELCRALEIEVVDDPSNRDPAFLRNRVRHEVLPLLSEVAGRDVVPVLVRQGELLRDGADLLSALAADLDPTDADALAEAPSAIARQAVRDWIWRTRADEHPPDLATVDRLLQVARLEARAADIGKGWRVLRSRRRLRLEPPG